MLGQGFNWFIAKVEDIDDPKQLGRARIRIVNEHPPELTTDKLPWASIVAPATSASHRGIGVTPVGLKEGSTVIGFFIDAYGQYPTILGTWHFVPDEENHDVTGLARGQDLVDKRKATGEPDPSYAARYPYNQVLQTEAGHVVEIDDTPGAERIHVYHKAGTYIEINQDGRIIIKSVNDSFDITEGAKNIYVKGNCNIQTDGKLNLASKQDMTIVSQGNMTLGAQGNMVISGAGGMELRSGYGVTTQSPGGLTVGQGSITTFGNITNGTGLTGSVVAGGTWMEFRDGILTGMGGGT
jgi:hypothetical protein